MARVSGNISRFSHTVLTIYYSSNGSKTMYLTILIAGFEGGVIRGLVGFIKHQFAYKNVGFKVPYFLLMMFLSGIVGLLVTIAVRETGVSFLGLDRFAPAVAFIIGYAGGDFIENIYKIIVKKSSLYYLPQEIQKKDK